MSAFWITGLPRSRSAWFSVATTTAQSLCLHEPCFGDSGVAATIWNRTDRAHVGIACSALALHARAILDTVAPRTLVVRRDPAAVIASLRRYVGDEIGLDERALRRLLADLEMALDNVAKHPKVLVVDYAALDAPGVLEACLAHLLPRVDVPNLDQLRHMRINLDLGYAIAQVARSHALEEAA